MSTRSRIAIQRDAGFESIYCHSDGYVEGVGKTLAEHYSNVDQVELLIALGDISYVEARVAPEPGEPHGFGNAAEGVTVAYGRDRGETGCEPVSSHNLIALQALADASSAEYLYVFAAGQWSVSYCGEVRMPFFRSTSGRWTDAVAVTAALKAAGA